MKTRPRTPTAHKRTARITVTLTSREAASIRARAKQAGLSASEYLRQLAIKAS